MNNAFEKNLSPNDENEYDSISGALATGPRRKENDLYESTPTPSPCLPRRKNPWVTDESLSDRSSRTFSSSSGGFSARKGKAGVSKLGLFFMLVNFTVSSAALALVALIITGIYGPKCICKQEQREAFVSPPQTGMSGNGNVQSLQRRIVDLEKKTEEMRAEMNQNKIVSNEVKFLQNRISAQERLLNETAIKVNSERPSTGTKLPSAEIDLMNKSINALKSISNEVKFLQNRLSAQERLLNETAIKVNSERPTTGTKLPSAEIDLMNKSINALKSISNEVKFLQNRLSAQERLLNETAIKVNSERPTTGTKLPSAEIVLMNKSINALKSISNEVKFLQNRLSVQERLLNETAIKVNSERPTTGTKLPSAEIDLMNKSINALKSSDRELKTTVNNLQLSFAVVKGIAVKLTANVSFFEIQMQRMRNSSNHLNRKAEKLETSYAHVTSVMNAFERLNSAQNTSLDALRYGYKRLENGMAAVNATLKKKLDSSAAANFSSCTHRLIKGAPVSAGDSAHASISYQEPEGKRVMGITCSTDYAHEFLLETWTERKGFYLCKCSGLSDRGKFPHPQPKTVNCFLNLWECKINK